MMRKVQRNSRPREVPDLTLSQGGIAQLGHLLSKPVATHALKVNQIADQLVFNKNPSLTQKCVWCFHSGGGRQLYNMNYLEREKFKIG